MTMHPRTVFLAATIVIFAASHGLADQKSHRKVAEELLKTMGVDKQLESSIDQMVDLQVKASKDLAPYRQAMKNFYAKCLSWDSLKDEYVSIYTEAFTEEELKEILAFYKTRAGKKMIEKTPDISSKGMQLGFKRVQENQAELIRMIKEASSSSNTKP